VSNSTGGTLRILIVHFNTPDMTSRLIRDLPRETPQGRGIFVHVFDNCSTPQNLRTLRANVENIPGITLEASNENVGFGAGINALVEREDVGSSDILWILNSDTRVTTACLGLLEDQLDSGDFAVVSPLIYSGDAEHSSIWYCGGTMSTHDAIVRHQYQGARLTEAPSRPFETEFITGAAPMMLASTFRDVGGFPPGYFMYWEDAFFCWKARALGFRLGVVPSAHLWHAIGASSGSLESATYFYWSTRNRFAFARDTGVPRRRLMVGRAGLESLRPIARALLVGGEGRLSKTSAAIRGTLSGLRKPHPAKDI
jgi:N-acetylglucosaminyl-diphospho-decaprenol L-rhamnosyltransferase